MSSDPKPKRLVVIGNGMAGVAAVEEVLKLDPTVAVTIFGDEPHVNYNRILLSDVVAGKRAAKDIVLNPREWYEQNRIDLRAGARVASIDPEGKTVTDASGAVTPFDRLLIAVGGSPFIPPMQGADKAGVLCFRTLEDCERILDLAQKSRRAVVIGGGLLGLEAARGLINHGLSVTVVHLMDRLMELQLDDLGAALLKREMERMGIEFLLNTTATEILGNGKVEGIRLKSGEDMPADLVLVCTGVRPNLELARAAGLAAHRGLIVNDRLQTSHPDIFAVGDVVEHRGKVYGFIDPIREQVRVAADAMVGPGALRYEGSVCATVLKVAGVELMSAGQFLGGPGYEKLVFIDSTKGVYKKVVLQRGRLVGMILLGTKKNGQELFNLIKSGREVTDRMAEIQSMVNEQVAAKDRIVISGTAMADTDQVCNCNSVSKGTIVKAIREKDCKTVADVARCTKASTGCGSCASLVDTIIKETLGGRPAPPAPQRFDVPREYPRVLPVEKIKQEGLSLDWEKIRQQGAFALSEDDYYRLKTYGVCSQKHAGFFMMRIRIPGGKVTAKQLMALAEVADLHGRGWGHLTTRQDIELHWVKVDEVPAIWDRLERVGITTRSSCGHTMRNVAACPHSHICPCAKVDAHAWAKAISDHFVQRSDYINSKMPNRLNIYFAGGPDCGGEAQINDIAFVPVRKEAEPGFEAWVGGSLGKRAMLGFKIRDFVTPSEVLAVCQTIFEIHMKHGIRTKEKSRLKHLIEDWGREKFTAEFEKVFAEKKAMPENRAFQIPLAITPKKPALPSFFERILYAFSPLPRMGERVRVRGSQSFPPGCHPQSEPGYVRVELDVTLGEIEGWQIREAAEICRRYGNGEACFTKDQDIEFHYVRAAKLPLLIEHLKRARLKLKDRSKNLRVTACVGTEFCVLAVTNSQGAARDIIKKFSPIDPAKAALLEGLLISISGCPNSCTKQQLADIGLVGSMSAVGEEKRYSYTMVACGRIGQGGQGDAKVELAQPVARQVTEDMVVPTLDSLLDVILLNRTSGETVRDTIGRLGFAAVEKMIEQRLIDKMPKSEKRVGLVPEVVEAS